MKRVTTLLLICLLVMALSQCSSNETKAPDETQSTKIIEEKILEKTSEEEQSTQGNQGFPEIKEINISEAINEELALAGAEVFSAKCTMCHKPNEEFIGPAAHGVLERRTPEWLMKMIMYPDLMQEQDAVVQKLIEDYNGAIMPNQNITFEEARSIIEYYRTL